MRDHGHKREPWNATGTALASALAILGALAGFALGYMGGDGIVLRKIMIPMDVDYAGEWTGLSWLTGLLGIAAGCVAGVMFGIFAGRNLGILAADDSGRPRAGRGATALASPLLGAVGSWWGAMGVLILDYAAELNGKALLLLPVGGAMGWLAGFSLGRGLGRLFRNV